MSEQQVFVAPNLDVNHLAQAVGDWYRAQRFDVQVLAIPDQGMVVQARQQEGWRNALGLASALNVGLRYKENTLIVEIGAGKWADKAIAGGVGVLLVWPLFFTAAYGAWKQSQMPQRTFQFIQAFLGGGAAQNPYAYPPDASPYPPAPPPQKRNAAGDAPTEITRRFCENCGTALSPTAKFCSGCGAKVS
jgi:zinc ribbon protein